MELFDKIFNRPGRRNFGMHLLRLGMSAVFLWFGFSQLSDPSYWASYVPNWAISLLPVSPLLIVVGNGFFEIILGALMAMGFFVRLVSFLLALHLLPIALSFGLSEIGVRDLGLSIASFALSFIYKKPNPATSHM